MKRAIFLHRVIIIFIFFFHGIIATQENESLVKLKDGSQITGLILYLKVPNSPPIRVYYGVRYASLGPVKRAEWSTEPSPVEHRFSHSVASFFYEAPVDVDAKTTLPPVCPQPQPDVGQIEREQLPSVYAHWSRLAPFLKYQSEDCLTLNLYVPKADDLERSVQSKPVLLFVHGESFEQGSGNAYDLSILASFTNTICITMNYRLGIFGFLTLKHGQSNGNFALFDLQAAILWIRANIDAFGGNPDQITLMGYGHGAALVQLFSMSKLGQGIGDKAIKRIILLSGSALAPWAMGTFDVDIYKKLIERFNITVAEADQKVSTSEQPHVKSPWLDSSPSTAPYALTRQPTSNNTPEVPRPSKLLLDKLKTLTSKELISLQDALGDGPCETRFGPSPSTHLFLCFLTSCSTQEKTKRRESEQLKSTLFGSADLLVGNVLNAGNEWYRRSEWTGSLVEGLSRCMENVFPYQSQVIAELINYMRFNGDQKSGQDSKDESHQQTEDIVSILSDGFYSTPAIQTVKLHDQLKNQGRNKNTRNPKTYLFSFECPIKRTRATVFNQGQNQNHEDFSNKPGFRDDLAYLLGAPLKGAGQIDPFTDEYTQEDERVSKRLMTVLKNFIYTGNPNRGPLGFLERPMSPYWPEYDAQAQAYMTVDKLTTKSQLGPYWGGNLRADDQLSIRYGTQDTHTSVWPQLIPRIAGLPKRPPTMENVESSASTKRRNGTSSGKIEPVPWSPQSGSVESLLYYFHLRTRQREWFDSEFGESNKTTQGSPIDSASKSRKSTGVYTDGIRWELMTQASSPQTDMLTQPTDTVASTKGEASKEATEVEQQRENLFNENLDPGVRRALMWVVCGSATVFLLNIIIFFAIYIQTKTCRSKQTGDIDESESAAQSPQDHNMRPRLRSQGCCPLKLRRRSHRSQRIIRSGTATGTMNPALQPLLSAGNQLTQGSAKIAMNLMNQDVPNLSPQQPPYMTQVHHEQPNQFK